MIRRSAFVFLALFIPVLSASAQVGHSPESSPYQDLRGKHAVIISTGWMAPNVDPANVGPHNGMMWSGRYELFLTGPLWLTTRLAIAPSIDRTVKDPDLPGPSHVIGTDSDPLVITDVGLALNLTGNKAWHGIAPRVSGSLGMASTFSSSYDLGGYRFGTKFVMGYGAGVRYVTGSQWEANLDITRFIWQNKYPETYRDGSSSGESVMGTRPLGPWSTNTLISVGVARYFKR